LAGGLLVKVLFVESDEVQEYNCSMWRCVVPSRGLLKAGVQSVVMHLRDWVLRGPEATELTEAADIIFVQRNTFGSVLETLLYWRDKGKLLVVDIDDAYEYMTENTGSPSYEFWINNRVEAEQGKYQQIHPKPLEQLKWGIEICGNFSSPSKLLCEDWKDHARTYWFPNYIDGSIYKRREVYRPIDKIYIAWGGSATHLVSWTGSGLSAACKQIMTEFPNVDLLLFGDPRVQKFVDMSPGRKSALGWIPGAQFATKMCMADIGVVPLFGEYDRRRSWIKSLEYTILGVPWIGSAAEPNQDIIVSSGVLTKNTAADWYEALKYYIVNLAERKAEAIENIPVGEAYTIENNTGTLLALFERIIKENS
jgi:glycosyltransferase involved in cell wall biosynthesis